MPHHTRTSLDYFPVDTSWDLKMRLILANFGMEGIGAIIQLKQMIFREGYACDWNEETEHLFIIENNTTKERIDKILEYCLDHDFFDRTILDHYGVLTSKAIQLQWLKVRELCRRKTCAIESALSLVDSADIEECQDDLAKGKAQNDSERAQKNSDKTPSDSEKFRENSEKLRQRKGSNGRNERKGIKPDSKDENHREPPSPPCHQDFLRAGESPMMQQILRSLETKKQKSPD